MKEIAESISDGIFLAFFFFFCVCIWRDGKCYIRINLTSVNNAGTAAPVQAARTELREGLETF